MNVRVLWRGMEGRHGDFRCFEVGQIEGVRRSKLNTSRLVLTDDNKNKGESNSDDERQKAG